MATASQEFKAWLDTVCVDTSAWRKEDDSPDGVYYTNADKKERKKQGYIHRYMMGKDWYRRSLEHHRALMELEESELGLEPEPLTIDQKGFWDQF